MKTQVLIEVLDLSEAVIDADNRTVRQKIITAGKSKNGRYYSEAVLEKAASLFENTKAFANHPSKGDLKDRPERSVREITGWLSNVTYESGSLMATRHFTRTQAGNDSWALVQDIREGRAPASLMGASINAIGTGKREKLEGEDVLVVEAITGVNSVDDVTSPAAGGGWERLMMSAPDDLALQVLSALDYQEWIEARPEYTDRLKREWKQIRQDDAVKAVQIVADQLKTALTEAQAEIETLKSDKAMLSGELNQTRRELAIERALVKVQLPAQWKASLRNRLLEVETERWESIIEEELTKARANGKPRIAVTGAGQQISQPIAEASKPHNTAPDWNKVLESPEAFAAWKAQVNRSN